MKGRAVFHVERGPDAIRSNIPPHHIHEGIDGDSTVPRGTRMSVTRWCARRPSPGLTVEDRVVVHAERGAETPRHVLLERGEEADEKAPMRLHRSTWNTQGRREAVAGVVWHRRGVVREAAEVRTMFHVERHGMSPRTPRPAARQKLAMLGRVPRGTRMRTAR